MLFVASQSKLIQHFVTARLMSTSYTINSIGPGKSSWHIPSYTTFIHRHSSLSYSRDGTSGTCSVVLLSNECLLINFHLLIMIFYGSKICWFVWMLLISVTINLILTADVFYFNFILVSAPCFPWIILKEMFD